MSKTTQKTTQKLSETEIRILGVIKENSMVTRNEIATILGNITPDGVKYHLSRLQKKGALDRKGGKRDGSWVVKIELTQMDKEC